MRKSKISGKKAPEENGELFWNEILEAAEEMCDWFNDAVFIGGVAVFLHTQKKMIQMDIAEFSHDADFYISLLSYSELRDIEEITQNVRLRKSQLIKKNVEMDIYVEHQHALVVPYEEMKQFAVKIDGINVASPCHLLILKLKAWQDRRNSAKGQKDKRDIICILSVMDVDPGLKTTVPMGILRKYLSTDDIKDLTDIVMDFSIFSTMTDNRVKDAKKIQDIVKKVLYAIQTECEYTSAGDKKDQSGRLKKNDAGPAL